MGRRLYVCQVHVHDDKISECNEGKDCLLVRGEMIRERELPSPKPAQPIQSWLTFIFSYLWPRETETVEHVAECRE